MPKPASRADGRRQHKTASKTLSSNKRVRKHRDKLRAAGLRPVQLWVWDTTRPGFADQVRRECELINASTDNERVLEEMLSIADFSGWK
jgi:hypothetical protein